MSLRRFLNVAYAVLVEEFQRSGADLQSALGKVKDLAEGIVPDSPPAPAISPVQNEQAMAVLAKEMQGMSNIPRRRGRRPRSA